MQTHCSYCGCKTLPSPDEQSPYRVLDGVNRHQKRRSFDHIFPREWGGKDAADNFRVSCQDCNEFRAECGHCVGAMACVLAVTSKESWSAITRPRFVAREWFRFLNINGGRPMQYQFQVDNSAAGPVRDDWHQAVQDARNYGYTEFADAVTFPGGSAQWSKTGPSIMRIVKGGKPVIVGGIDHTRSPQETEAQRENRVAPDHSPEEIEIAIQHQQYANHTVDADEDYARKAEIPNLPRSQ